MLTENLFAVSAFEIAGPEQLLPGAKEGKTCPKDLQCAQPPELEQDPVYELGASGDTVGGSRQLRGIEGRRDALDEKPRTGNGAVSYPG